MLSLTCHVAMETVLFSYTRDTFGVEEMLALLSLPFSSQIANHAHSWHQRLGTDWHSFGHGLITDCNTKAIIHITNKVEGDRNQICCYLRRWNIDWGPSGKMSCKLSSSN